ncbi:probable maf protein implicated in inhibition of septum formation [Psychrobacter arcticus 273-4]|uniref:dTTP/UTP pyrophosphatase n=1 Tax=Psychrobacter arcticus (strain DSM 17307 / VKM B-2377 / 273-4) TaxID=259536 RepID=NTPPA_PSYA2|nr:Maf family protein [Psychrobacter arcticus]Q4FUF9.1 RecName: Full=dTTP/UTP pyrophosphatase; Short=dTTPase/UTPase; AltName: Full=Nucleoside triphosphate pyrophosphatase; AltName: Full=Nucleotide pyrophosphatase; Short=Nucleotide PPase [Psychrobacter arcticus 273-4]AAZ18349.1 probable maf protein implicated in inhibition of septum formation [Psychrobacter arcticus 273-4]
MDIILASGSPRRRELLSRAQLEFTIISVDIDETPYQDELPKDYIVRMVAAKAEAAATQLNIQLKNNEAHSSKSLLSQPIILLTSDTIGVLPDGKTVLIKPSNREDAYHMWQQMSDSTHEVWTAVQATQLSLHSKHTDEFDTEPVWQIINQKQIIERTEVTFIALTPEMMSDYWDGGEPADKAGGYGIQGLGAAWVSRINGSYTNVVGLPLAQTLALIKEMTNTAMLENFDA